MINFKEDENLHVLNHSCAHLMAQAVKHLYPHAKFWVGPVVDEGFYYDMDLGDDVIHDEDLEKIEKEMKKCSKDAKKIIGREVTKEEALELFKDDVYKLDLINGMEDGEPITVYTQGDYMDLCRGPHMENTKQVKYFKLLKHSGAYWKGDKNNKVLQRVYGVCLPTQEELDAYLEELEDMKARDHRKLGKDMQMFMFSDLVGAGLPIWLPNGFTLRRIMADYMMNLELNNGYVHVKTPVVANVRLYKTSGHWAHYRDDMFPEMGMDEDESYVLRPMNCPEHMVIYKSQLHSYRDLPIRIAEIADDFRYEASGALTGMERLRGFAQNDSHIFVRADQIKEECQRVLDLIIGVYRDFGINNYRFRLSLRDINNKDKYFGNDELWELSETALREVLVERNVPFYEAPGEAAFYGPKIDVQIRTALGHDVTMSTVQVDYQLPLRFELNYIGANGQKETPIVIHRAILGSLDRFMAILLEETKGVLPVWLAPVQVEILPVSPEKHGPYAAELAAALRAKGIRTEVDERNEKLGYRVREAQTKKIPVELVVGDQEAESHGVTLRRYGSKDEVKMSFAEFAEMIEKEIAAKSVKA
ncbi:MAG: threonine--tRNA ligase [Erysipelotrichaceae bacterium]|nr:threonine--tRNA ligase [Erysipelotrichaceae bacterium]